MSRVKKRVGCDDTPERPLRTLADVVSDYRTRYRRAVQDEWAFFASQRSLAEAVRLAARARTHDDKRHPHQYRLSESVLRKCEVVLGASLAELKSAKDFDELFRVIDSAIGDIHGVGELMVYDTSTRIGAYLGLGPRFVYLHAGVRRGAATLGLAAREERLKVDALPKPLDRLDASSAEDVLCIYKDCLAFRRFRESQPRSRSR